MEAITNGTVLEALQQLDEMRHEFEVRGRFLDAQKCVDYMKKVSNRESARLNYELSRAAMSERAARILKQEQELRRFSEKWAAKLHEFEDRAAACLDDLKKKHHSERAQHEETLKAQLSAKRPHFTKETLHLRAALQKAVDARRYVEAEKLKHQLVARESKEITEFDKLLRASYTKRLQILRKQHAIEMSTLKHKIRCGKEELEKHRTSEYESILRRHKASQKDTSLSHVQNEWSHHSRKESLDPSSSRHGSHTNLQRVQ